MWPALAAFVAFYPANLGIIPFDIPEAETEVLEGPLLEYSGPVLALFKVMSALKKVVVLSLGIDGTEMAAFSDQLDERQRWDLATYIAGLSADPSASKADKTYNLADLARQTPNEVLAAEGPEATATFRAQRAQPPQVKRGPAQLLDYTSATLDKSLAAYRAGDREQAYDLSVAAYLEGFELVESSLDNVNANVRKDTEKALMAYRQSLQDGLPDRKSVV